MKKGGGRDGALVFESELTLGLQNFLELDTMSSLAKLVDEQSQNYHLPFFVGVWLISGFSDFLSTRHSRPDQQHSRPSSGDLVKLRTSNGRNPNLFMTNYLEKLVFFMPANGIHENFMMALDILIVKKKFHVMNTDYKERSLESIVYRLVYCVQHSPYIH